MASIFLGQCEYQIPTVIAYANIEIRLDQMPSPPSAICGKGTPETLTLSRGYRLQDRDRSPTTAFYPRAQRLHAALVYKRILRDPGRLMSLVPGLEGTSLCSSRSQLCRLTAVSASCKRIYGIPCPLSYPMGISRPSSRGRISTYQELMRQRRRESAGS